MAKTHRVDIGSLNAIGQDFVITDYLTAVNGAPGAGQFRSSITNRSDIPNFANDLLPRMGIETILAQQTYKMQKEVGSNGEVVWGVSGDKFNQIRLVGLVNVMNDPTSTRIRMDGDDTYAEIVFYGTGLNVLTLYDTTARDIRVSVDGGAEGSNIYTTGSAILTSRNYAQNAVLNVTYGLSLGLHTIKLRRNSAGAGFFSIYGFQILNETASLQVPTGSAYINKAAISHSALESISYNSGFESGVLGTKGGRVVVYEKSDKTIGKVLTPVDTSAAYIASTDHTNEEVDRVYYYREFGAGRSDDFSTLFSTTRDNSFTLNDGTTTLIGNQCRVSTSWDGIDMPSNSVSFITFTFVGCGLDIVRQDSATGADVTWSVYVDASSVGPLSSTGITSQRIDKICSGLPYGTHTVRISRGVPTTWGPIISSFIVYKPKKPTLPSDVIELSDYCLLANYGNLAAESGLTVSNGVIRRCTTVREATYVGVGWAMAALDPVNRILAWDTYTSTAGDYMELPFWGTGVELRPNSELVSDGIISIDGSTNLSGYTTSTTGGALTFVAATGAYGGNSSPGARISIYNIPLGFHKLRVTRGASFGNGCFIGCVDVITPIYSSKSFNSNIQNNLPVPFCSASDTRKLEAIASDEVSNYKVVASAVGVVSDPTTTSTVDVPIPDLTISFYAKKGTYAAFSNVSFTMGTTSGHIYARIACDGIPICPHNDYCMVGANYYVAAPMVGQVSLEEGWHTIQVVWQCGGGGPATAKSTYRNLVVAQVSP